MKKRFAIMILLFLNLLALMYLSARLLTEPFGVYQEPYNGREASIVISNGKDIEAYDVEVIDGRMYINILTE